MYDGLRCVGLNVVGVVMYYRGGRFGASCLLVIGSLSVCVVFFGGDDWSIPNRFSGWDASLA
jgi:hypothetical protein